MPSVACYERRAMMFSKTTLEKCCKNAIPVSARPSAYSISFTDSTDARAMRHRNPHDADGDERSFDIGHAGVEHCRDGDGKMMLGNASITSMNPIATELTSSAAITGDHSQHRADEQRCRRR